MHEPVLNTNDIGLLAHVHGAAAGSNSRMHWQGLGTMFLHTPYSVLRTIIVPSLNGPNGSGGQMWLVAHFQPLSICPVTKLILAHFKQ
jgi:hypothetical protein